MIYRKEIDGLRAIAVISVIIYHAKIALSPNLQFLSGGFLGVDIFFVISGYLITTQIIGKLKEKNFSLLDFYERRARRILPALLFVIIAVTPFAWSIMTTKSFNDYTSSIIYTIFFISNILFFLQDNYAAQASELKPLLHTWSLAIEEQYYLIYPLLVILLFYACRKNYLKGLIILAVTSLILSIWSTPVSPDASFFLLYSRAWELLAGAILAIIEIEYTKRYFKFKYLNSIALYTCLFLLLVSLWFFDHKTVHPGIFTIIPVGCTVGLLYFITKNSIIYSILTSKIFSLTGLISYSLYLWHQPIFSLMRINSMGPLSLEQKSICVLIVIMLSVVSYNFIEKPYRNKSKVPASRLYFSYCFSALFFIVAASFTSNNLFLENRKHKILYSLGEQKPWKLLKQNNKNCFNTDVQEACKWNTNNKDHWYFVGDSHISSLLTSMLPKINKANIWTHIAWNCFYAPGAYIDNKKQYCGPNINKQRKAYLLSNKPGIVVIGGGLNINLKGEPYQNKKYFSTNISENTITKNLIVSNKLDTLQNKLMMKIVIKKAIQELLRYGHTVVLIYPIPETGINVPQVINSIINKKDSLELSNWLNNNGLTTQYSFFREYTNDVYSIYNSIGQHPSLKRIFPEDILCNKEQNICYTHNKDDVYYYDKNHLTLKTTEKISLEILRILDSKKNISEL